MQFADYQLLVAPPYLGLCRHVLLYMFLPRRQPRFTLDILWAVSKGLVNIKTQFPSIVAGHNTTDQFSKSVLKHHSDSSNGAACCVLSWIPIKLHQRSNHSLVCIWSLYEGWLAEQGRCPKSTMLTPAAKAG